MATKVKIDFMLMIYRLKYWRNFCVIFLAIIIFPSIGLASNISLISPNDLLLIGNKTSYFEDVDGHLTIDQIISEEYQKKFIQQEKEVFNRPATRSAFWFKITMSNNCKEDAWLEVGSTYAWNIDFYAPDTLGRYTERIETGTMRPDSNKLYDVNLFWLPLNKANDEALKNYYVRITSGSTYELPLHIGTLRSLNKNKDINDYFTAGFIGLMLVMFLYNLFLYLYIRDKIYLLYLGYLFMMIISMPYANGYPFIQNIDFLFLDKAWWNNNFLFWHPIVYFFIGEFCVRYLNLKENALMLKKAIRGLIYVIAIVYPILTLFGIAFVDLVNSFQVLILILYLLCLAAGYYVVSQRKKQAFFYVIGWTFMIAFTFVFFGVINGLLPFNPITRNALYIGTGLEVWMFSLALGNRLNILEKEKNAVELKNAELVRQQNILLEEKVNERTLTLEKTNVDLKNKNEELKSITEDLNAKSNQLKKMNNTKDRLFTIISHDLQSPLITLRNLIQMAENRFLDADGYAQLAEKIKSDVEHVHFSLNNLLHWAVTQMQGIILEKEKLAVLPLVKENEQLFQEMARNKNIDIEIAVDQNLKIFADPNVVRLIIRNILNNAVKYTPLKGTIKMGAEELTDAIKIYITDSGIGMSEQQVQSLFANISNSSTLGTKGEKGTGLGLKICQEFIEKSNGEIWVESVEGKGTTFNFSLPKG